jgi:glycosyltransferase involved in cell wall biosynthesis
MATCMISVIIPTYNYAHTLERALYSVVTQLDENCELIIIDDGSTDNTRFLVEGWLKKLPNQFRFFQKENGGAASARNFGVSKSNGLYLVFLDADDLMADGALEALKAQIIKYPKAEFIIGAHYSVSANNRKKLHLPYKLPVSAFTRVKYYLIDKKISLSNGAWAMHRCIFDNIKYPEQFKNSEDIPVFTYALANCNCVNLNKAMAHIYKHNDSLRHDFDKTEDVGITLVDEVFNSLYISEEIQALKSQYKAQRLLSLFRVAYESGRYTLARSYYKKACITNWKVVFKISYTKKILKTLIKEIF